MVWLDDQFLLSASRDSNVVLWKVDGDDLEVDPVSNLYKMKTEEPTNLFNYEEIEKIRCMNFVRKRNVSLFSRFEMRLSPNFERNFILKSD